MYILSSFVYWKTCPLWALLLLIYNRKIKYVGILWVKEQRSQKYNLFMQAFLPSNPERQGVPSCAFFPWSIQMSQAQYNPNCLYE